MLVTASQLPITDQRAVGLRLRTICGVTAAVVAIVLVFVISFDVGGSLAEWTLRDMFLVLLPLAAVSFGSIWVGGRRGHGEDAARRQGPSGRVNVKPGP